MTVVEPVPTSAEPLQAKLDAIEEQLDASRAFLSVRAPAAYRRARLLLSAAEAELMELALTTPADAPAGRRLLGMCDEIGGSLLAAAVLQDSGGSMGAASKILTRAAEAISARLHTI